MEHVTHNIPPVYNENSAVLVLGSFPSVKSREACFFYGHKRNRFWQVLSTLLDCPLPSTVEEKKALLLSGGIAVWDVIASCDIKGSSDSSIKNAVPNPIGQILKEAPIRQIFCNGNTSYTLYQKYCEPETQQKAIRLPSTSPANAAFSLEKLVTEWSVLLPFLTDLPPAAL